MKTSILWTIIVSLSIFDLQAGPVRDMMVNNPEQLETTISNSSYADLLAFVNNAFSESQSETDGLAQYAYVATLAKAPADKQVDLAIDFSLAKADLSLKASGAAAISTALLNGTTVSSAQRDRAKAKLKSELQALTTKGQNSYYFAQKAAVALIMLSDNDGLDVFLTDTKMVRSYSLKDKWTPISTVATFQQLNDAYMQRASVSGKEWDKIMAKIYELSKARRASGIEVKALQPLVNLQSLLQ